MLQEFPVSTESQIIVLKAVIGALCHDQVVKLLLFVEFKPISANVIKVSGQVNVLFSVAVLNRGPIHSN